MARILVAGGSLGGLMAANLLARAGHQVTVLEKAVGAMDGRGAGIVTHAALVRGLRQCGMDPDFALGVPVEGRTLLAPDGQVQGRLEMPQVLTSWGRLYRLLHELALQQPGLQYRQGVTVQGVDTVGDRVRLDTSAGPLDADLLVAADGIRSAVRQQLWPDVEPEYAGYVAWRGLTDEAVLSAGARALVFERFGFCVPPGEQLIGYPVAGAGDRTEAGRRAWNFVWYRGAFDAQRLRALLTDADGVHHPQGIPPHKVNWREVARMRREAADLLAPAFAEIVEKCGQPFLQPIYDLASTAIARGRVALLGDAAFVARPHVGMGVTKAMQDAMALAEAVRLHGAQPQALAAYEQARLGPAREVVERGRRLGAYMQSCGQGSGMPQDEAARWVMAATAIDPERPQPEPPTRSPEAGARPAVLPT